MGNTYNRALNPDSYQTGYAKINYKERFVNFKITLC